MGIPESIVVFAGFVFAHAVWNVSDLPKNELLVPIVMVERSGKRELMRFEAETQVEAIAAAKKWLEKNGSIVDSWVFAREGQMKESDHYVDTLIVEAKTKGMKESVIFIQKFQPCASGKFVLIGDPEVAIGTNIVGEKDAVKLNVQLMKGVQTHSKAFELWSTWSPPKGTK